MVQFPKGGTPARAGLKRLVVCATAWLVACIAQPASADAASDDTDLRLAEMADLSATISAPAFVTRGDKINLSLQVRNAGPNEAAVVSVRLELEAALHIAEVKISGGTTTPNPGAVGSCIHADSTFSCTLPQLPSGSSYTFDVVTSPTTVAGSFGHIALVEGSGRDLSLANNSASSATTVSEFVVARDSGGGGGSISWWMLAALLLLSVGRALSVRVQQPEPNLRGGNRLLIALGAEIS